MPGGVVVVAGGARGAWLGRDGRRRARGALVVHLLGVQGSRAVGGQGVSGGGGWQVMEGRKVIRREVARYDHR